MTKIDEQEAASTLEFIKQLGTLYEDEMRDFSAEAPL
jgi:hydrogenase maturation factor